MDQVEKMVELVEVKGEEEQKKKTNKGPGANFNGFRSDGILPLSKPNQMTIFCAGSVCVFENITPAKAHAIMLIAAATAADSKTQVMTTSQSSQSSNAPPVSPHSQPTEANSLCKVHQGDLPIARRNSLQLFLEKRRNRLVSKGPYIVKKEPESPGRSNLTSEL